MAVDVSFHALASSAGMRQSERQAMASWSFMGMGRTADEVTGFDYDSNFALTADSILPRSLADAEQFVRRILGLFKPGRCLSYKGPVLLSPRAVHELIVGMILYHSGGRQVMDGKSRWDKAVGTQVVSPLLTLSDNPHDQRFSGATAFDSDGVPTRGQTIVDKGVLQRHLHDCYSAKRCHAASTATAGGPFALALGAGQTPLAELLRAAPQLLLVDRFSGNSDAIKGDFSGVAKSSRLYVGGEDRGSVTETMIAGNFFALKDSVLAVSREVEIVSGGFVSPYILVDGVSVTGQQ
jgi:PmbA protein